MNSKTYPEKFFTILHTNDEHSSLIPHGPAIDHHQGSSPNTTRGGFARLASWVQNQRKTKEKSGEPTLLVSSGDIIGSNPFSWLIYRGYAPELKIMQKMGYELITIGNHELQQGPEILGNYYFNGGYPPENHSSTTILGTNVHFPGQYFMSSKGIYQRTSIKTLANGLKVGFLGILGYDAIEILNQSKIGGFRLRDPIISIRRFIRELKEEGAEVIIALNHAGLEINKKIARRIEGLDLIIGGHEHLFTEEPVIESGTIIVEAGECLKYAGMLELAYDPTKKQIRLRNQENGTPFLHPLDSQIEEDPNIYTEVKYYTEELNKVVAEFTGGKINNILSPVVSIPYDLPNTPCQQDNPLGNFVTDAMRLMSQEITGNKVDLAFQGTGIFRLPLTTGKTRVTQHQVSFYDLAEVQEILYGPDGEAGTPLVSFYLTGKELRYLAEISVLGGETIEDYYSLQVSGMRFYYNPQRSVLGKLPVAGFPIPTFRAVHHAEIFTGEGRQTDNEAEYTPLNKKNNNLYHVVTDYLLAKAAFSHLHKIPYINKIPKNKFGKPLTNMEEAIIYDGKKPYKVWQAVVDYALSYPAGPEGLPRIDDYYRKTPRRIFPGTRGVRRESATC